uniref:Uncharacterized protein n=1 Tax=Cannabis sativa TaxID=3483 RepID=A0A803QQF9_CANSA
MDLNREFHLDAMKIEENPTATLGGYSIWVVIKSKGKGKVVWHAKLYATEAGMRNIPGLMWHRFSTAEESTFVSTDGGWGQSQALKKVKEVIARDLAKIITEATKEDKLLEGYWMLCHPNSLTGEEEILERYVVACLNGGVSGDSTFRRGNKPFRVLRTPGPSLYRMSRMDQGGFDRYFLNLDHLKYPEKDFLDRIDEIVRIPNNLESSPETIRMDPFMTMSFPNFREYDNFIDWDDIVLFARGEPYGCSLNKWLLANHLIDMFAYTPEAKMMRSLSDKIIKSLAQTEGTKGKGKVKARAFKTRKPRPPFTSSSLGVQEISPLVKASAKAFRVVQLTQVILNIKPWRRLHLLGHGGDSQENSKTTAISDESLDGPIFHRKGVFVTTKRQTPPQFERKAS